jgi:hypothetical protein
MKVHGISHWARCAVITAGMAAALGAQAQVIDFSGTRGAGINQSDVLLENLRLLVPVPNPQQPGTTTTVESNYNILFRFDPATLHLVPVGLQQTGGSGAVACASAQVTVFDALRGANQPLANASVTLGTRSSTTNAQGVASFTGLAQGFFTVTTAAPNYSPANQTVLLNCSAPNQVAVALSPASGGTGGLAAGQFRTILTWGENPRDIDSHLTGPAASGSSRWHVYFGAKSAGDMCALDVDDISSYGPETVTCPPTGSSAGALRPGVYRYSVHHYAGSGTLGTSNANVRLELSNGQAYTFTPPVAPYTGSNNVWTVYELTVLADGSVGVAPINSVMENVSSGSVSRELPLAAGTGLGQAESPSTFRNLVK